MVFDMLVEIPYLASPEYKQCTLWPELTSRGTCVAVTVISGFQVGIFVTPNPGA
jgi:hypothetical protein